jgi:choice-of-anchor B domain-containing protein
MITTELSAKTPVRFLLLALLLVALAWSLPGALRAQDPGDGPINLHPATAQEHARFLADKQPLQALEPLGPTACADGGKAAGYPCRNVDLLGLLPLSVLGGGYGNSIWGWTDPQTGKEYAIMGRSTGTSFVDISTPTAPVYLGNLPTHTTASDWRDMRVYNYHAYIISEAASHGMQVFDLTQLRAVTNPPVTFSETAHYAGFGSAHTLGINEETGYAYAAGGGGCIAGLHAVNLANPTNPTFAGCANMGVYTHETQCVLYHGPDPDYQGHELCFNSNGPTDSLAIVDVTNKSAPVTVGSQSYTDEGARYPHQGWLTEDHAYFAMNDEFDENYYGHNSRTYIWDVRDIEAPRLVGSYLGNTPAIDHNLYIRDGYVFEANYRAGLRILDLVDVAQANLSEVAYFDIYPADSDPAFNGAWNNYPFFESGVVIVSGIEQGLFILRPQLERCADFGGQFGVGIDDIQLVAGHWQVQRGAQAWDARFDLNRNGTVEVNDLMDAASHWGATCTTRST